MARQMDPDELRAEIDTVDAKISEHGRAIEKARKAQRPLLERKDKLVTALNDRLRETGTTQNIGDDRG